MEREKQANQSTQAAFTLIEAMAAHGEPIGLSDLGRRTEMPRSRVYRLLQGLLAAGYVAQEVDGERYQLTLKLVHIGQAVAESTALTASARPVMMRLRDAAQQTVVLSSVERTGVRIIDMVRLDSPIQIVLRPGSQLPLHATAQGKLVLAFGDEHHRQAVASTTLLPETSHTIVDGGVLTREIEGVRARGWADAPEQTIIGLNALAAPVFDAGGKLIATMAIIGIMSNLPSPPAKAAIELVRGAAAEISKKLGHKAS